MKITTQITVPFWNKLFKKCILKSLSISVIMLVSMVASVQAQETTYTKPSLWLGVAAGANLNFYNGSTQNLNSEITAPVVFQKGFGVGLYAAPLIEYYRPESVFGVMFLAGYDGRSAKFDTELSPCNCPRDLSTKLSYLTLEPSLRIAPFRSNFYLFVGPRFAFNLAKSFTYQQGTNPDIPDQIAPADIESDFSNVNKTIISMQVGAGYDIVLSPEGKKYQFMLAPFVSLHPYFGQNPRSSETWNITTVRAGLALKIGKGKAKPIVDAPMVEPSIKLLVSTPVSVPTVNRISETYPVRNYIFFDEGSTKISNRYVLINKSKVNDFKKGQIEEFAPKQSSGRSARQMTVYYNVINILGVRLGENPNSTVTLVGSSENGKADGELMAQSVKDYLVNVFGISASRIQIEGRERAKLPSEKPGGTESLEMLRMEDRRVSIESNSPELLMEFQNGPNAPLKPIEIITINGFIDSTFSCSIDGVHCTSWSLEVKDEKGNKQTFGPFYEQKVIISNNEILGSRNEGNYRLTMIGTTITGQTLKTDTTVHLVKWVAPQIVEVMRFSVLYEYNDSKAITQYEKYLTDIVSPKIPTGGTVIINGYTDIVGDEGYNKDLSLSRAKDVKAILEASLAKAGRNDVKFEIYGNGENEKLAPFENKYPEERFYNRSVIIDLIPAK